MRERESLGGGGGQVELENKNNQTASTPERALKNQIKTKEEIPPRLPPTSRFDLIVPSTASGHLQRQIMAILYLIGFQKGRGESIVFVGKFSIDLTRRQFEDA